MIRATVNEVKERSVTTKTTGAEWKRFYADKAYWPEHAYHEDEEIIVDGKPWTWDAELMTVADAAKITVSGGVVYLKEHDREGPSVEAYFKHWRKAQSTVSFSCEAPRDLADAVKAAILAAGGKAQAI